jgi:predicted Holliday junction resolvase-like endonuclease
MSIIGIVLGTIAIGLFIWLKNDQKMTNVLHEGDLEAAKHAFEALMSDFNNYQITNERKIADLEKDMEIRLKSRDRRMDNMNKSLPSIIGQVVGQIEFSQDKINR